MPYLTNTPRRNRARVEEAARVSGLRIAYEDRPFPRDPCDPDQDNYFPNMLRGYGSIDSHESADVDIMPFWRAYDALKDS